MPPAVDPIVYYGLRIIVVCSVAHNLLPPFDWLDGFPTAQKYYKLLIYIVGYVALNARSTVWRQLSTADGTKPSVAANGKANGKTNGGANGGH